MLALPVEVLSLLSAGFFGWKALHTPTSLREVAGRLMKQVLTERQRFIDQALGVQWRTAPADVRFTNPNAGNLPTAMEELLINWQDLDGGRAGSIDDVSDFYRREPSGRLVVLGAPGAGKSVLLSHLVRDLIAQWLSTPENEWPVDWRLPLMLNLSGCDLSDPIDTTSQAQGRQLNVWIVRRLVEDYQLPMHDAAALVRDGHILLILDGLDEMDPTPHDADADGEHQRVDGATKLPHAAAVIQALNAERMPVVLACRDLAYQGFTVDAGDGAPSNPGLLIDAQHVVLQPLPAQEVIDYLTARFGSRTQTLPNRWQPVADALNAGKPLLRVLENPWQLFLAVKAYGQETSDPTELVAMTPDQADEQLLSALIPAVTDRDDTAVANGWTGEDVRHWLSSIADYQSRSFRPWRDSLTDIWLPDLWKVTKGPDFHFRELIREWITPIIAATPTLLVSLAFIVIGLRDRGGFLVVGVVLAMLGLGLGHEASSEKSPMARLDLGILRTSVGRAHYLLAVALLGLFSAALGLIFAVLFVVFAWIWSVCVEAAWQPDALWSWLKLWVSTGSTGFWLASVLLPQVKTVLLPGLVFGLALGLVPGSIEILRGELEIAPSPSVLARQSIRYHTAIGLASGLVFGVGIGLWSGQRLGLAPGLALGLLTGVAMAVGFGLANGGSAWLRYAVGVRAAVRQHLLPERPIPRLVSARRPYADGREQPAVPASQAPRLADFAH